jgi:hypothetical protein
MGEAVAEQQLKTDRWKTFLDYVVAPIALLAPVGLPPNHLLAMG